MTSEQHKTISLSEFAERAVKGESLEQKLNGGETLSVRVFTPDQESVIEVQRMMARVVKAATTAASEADISEADATLAYDMGFACLRACVRTEDGGEIPDAAFVDLFSKLPYKSDLMLRCQDLCGVGMMVIPPLDTKAAVEAMGAEAKAAGPNRKQRRATAKKG